MIPKRAFSTTGSTGLNNLTAWTLMTLFCLANPLAAGNAWSDDAVTLEIQSKAAYTLGPGDSKKLAHRLALFRAKVKAAWRAADRFEKRKLIQFVDRDKSELVDLVADRLRAEGVQDRYQIEGRTTTCSVETRTTVQLSDFIEAQLTSLRMGRQEDEDSYQHEMAPPVPSPLNPGRALAKVYRLMDKHELRMAIIYLNRLAEGYPNWGEIYELKAAAFRQQHQPVKMLVALRKACRLGSREACAQLK